ncbi:class I SAM-dependent methyltransferase [Methylobacterium sp. BTF04]|uniref:class I SAM-dependent methyltransferase n=1 Tax=Methylobacterium sp. BTF04 TaxID=2708300 RepID=UPI0013D5D2EE|nr:class I SAM-dependent methyltransferase [Methylobacterium sp. BTF04]NEU14090.1 class I SAM-dependent methyltransferase [Methylobacterium sp. BTF04]
MSSQTNKAFFDQFFPGDFWSSLDRSRFVEEDHSMFGDEHIFEFLIRTMRPQEIVEIGSWKGHSANYMMDLCKKNNIDARVVCIDTFLGGPEHWVLPGGLETLHRELGRPTILERFLGNTLARGNAGKIFPLTSDSYAASEILRLTDFKADLIFVDAGHDPVSVRNDIMRYYPRLSETGVMFGDDYQYEPLADTVHACARELGVQVLVSARKWVFANEALMRRITVPDVQVRQSFEGWVHP